MIKITKKELFSRNKNLREEIHKQGYEYEDFLIQRYFPDINEAGNLIEDYKPKQFNEDYMNLTKHEMKMKYKAGYELSPVGEETNNGYDTVRNETTHDLGGRYISYNGQAYAPEQIFTEPTHYATPDTLFTAFPNIYEFTRFKNRTEKLYSAFVKENANNPGFIYKVDGPHSPTRLRFFELNSMDFRYFNTRDEYKIKPLLISKVLIDTLTRVDNILKYFLEEDILYSYSAKGNSHLEIVECLALFNTLKQARWKLQSDKEIYSQMEFYNIRTYAIDKGRNFNGEDTPLYLLQSHSYEFNNYLNKTNLERGLLL